MSPANRYEQNTLQALAAALTSGLDPQQGLSIWNNLNSEYDSRVQAERQQAQQHLDQLRQLAVTSAQAGVPEQALQTQISGLYPHMSPRMSMGLDDTLTNLYPSGVPGQPGRDAQYSPLAPPPVDPNAFDDTDRAAIFSQVKEMAGATAKDPITGAVTANPVPLANVQATLRALYGTHYTPEVDAFVQSIYPIAQNPYMALPTAGPNPGATPAPAPNRMAPNNQAAAALQAQLGVTGNTPGITSMPNPFGF